MRKFNDYSDVDICELLDHYDIKYKTSGKNIGQNWLGVETCPFCGNGGYHLGINLSHNNYSCWVCGEKGGLPKFLKNLLTLTQFEIKEVLNKFGGNFQEIEEKEQSDSITFPTRLSKLSNLAENYLTNRGFNSKYLIKKYDLEQSGSLSKLKIGAKKYDFRNRIIVPIRMNNKIVSWSGRNFSTASSDARWKHAPNEASTRPIAEILYNVDNCKKDKVILVEGITDVWKMGDDSCGMMGIKFSERQIYEIIQRKFKKIVILFDSGAEDAAKKLAHTLMPFTRVQVSTLYVGDPGDLSEMDAVKLRYYLIGF